MMSRLPLAGVPLALAFALTTAGAQRGAPDSMVSAPISAIRYEVTADNAALAARQLGVSTSFDVASDGPVVLSLPAWTPGAYEISNFARNVINFRPTQDGVPLRWDKLDPDTWRVRPVKAGRVVVAFDFTADTLDNAMAWTRPDFALFNGTNTFMYPEGRSKDFAATVLIRTNPDFLIATGMPSAGAARTYKSGNYHDLVDMPFFVGKFDLDSATIQGKTFRYATYPVGSVAGEARTTAWDQLKRIVPAEYNVFGELPWDTYTLMQIIDSTSQGYSGLEHSSSHVDVVAPQFVGSDFQPSLYAHEIFHAWNVKRLRPADLVPYQYDRVQPTTWLWVSEGITDYYADLAEVRGGVVDHAGFYALTAGKIGEYAATIPFALEDASLNTWIHPRDGTGYSYYPKGSLAGLMLDITIRDATENKKSLDGVMKELYETTYKKGRGFTRSDFWGAMKKAANGRSFDVFEGLYIDGREAYPWPTMLRTIGLELVPDSVPRIGVTSTAEPSGAVRIMEVEAGSSASLAGVHVGDELLKVGDLPVADSDFGVKMRAQYSGRPAGSPLPIVVKRGTETLTLNGTLRYVQSEPRIAEDPAASAKAIKLREGILRGTVDK
ncbi:MAG: PDZ domain-containing protein [bacterium]